MKINSINNTTFTARQRSIKSTTNAIEKKLYTKETFYEHINKFLSDEMSKREYLVRFSNGIDEIQARRGGAEFTKVEKKYINDLVTTLDLTDKLEKISDTYLKDNMNKLLEANKLG